ncbi:MAG: hypothetical protein K6A67_02135 [Bacteroidales bacterium]|nr:hypothetical protein [Bacteroidales bacterium]
MKKLVIPTIAIIMLAIMASCNTKSCKCYIYDGVNRPERVIEYVDESSPCSSLDYTRTPRYRMCTEYNEPDINPDDIGQEYKK